MITAVVGDIATIAVDIVVTAANAAFSGGGGVDNAIHRAAGPALLTECRTLGAGRPGDVKLTRAYDLPARFVAHAVGPVWSGGDDGETAQLISCYERALELVVDNDARSIAFPAISTGAYRFPIERAAAIAVQTTRAWLQARDVDIDVTFVLFSERDLKIYQRLLLS